MDELVTIVCTRREVELIIYSLALKERRKRSSMRNLLKRQEDIIAEVGEKEFQHRMKLREKTADNSQALRNRLMEQIGFEFKKAVETVNP